MDSTLDEIIDSLKKGQSKRLKELIKIALDEGMTPQTILEDGFLRGMEELSAKFNQEEVGVPEILSITRALDRGVEALHRYTDGQKHKEIGTVILGAVNGNLHNIGKNLVRLMMESRSIRVIDLGVDVSPRKFYEEAIASKAKIVCLSGILPESGDDMRAVIDEFELKGVRDQFYFMTGGYGLSEVQAKRIGADCYTEDAGSCAQKAWQYLSRKEKKKKR